jgi:hypothetical protein
MCVLLRRTVVMISYGWHGEQQHTHTHTHTATPIMMRMMIDYVVGKKTRGFVEFSNFVTQKRPNFT